MKVITHTGKEYQISWMGVATVDGALRFEVTGSNLPDVFQTFSNRNETTILTQDWDGMTTHYVGYTRFKTIDIQPTQNIIVALDKE